MTKIILIAGLPGSGKSFLGKQLSEDGACFIDDISTDVEGLSKLLDATKKYDKVVVADTFLCREKDRENATKYLSRIENVEIEWIFFENNPEKCRKNVARRNDGRKVYGLITQLSKEYVIPNEVITCRIYDEELDS